MAPAAISDLPADMKAPPGCRAGQDAPIVLSFAHFPAPRLRRKAPFRLTSCETCVVMKRCICAVAFPPPPADLQYKVRHTVSGVKALMEMDGAIVAALR